jgi:hypothetical protein
MSNEVLYPITPEEKAAWVRALRSGKYQQGHGRLRSRSDGTDFFCCLGVLREVVPRIAPLVWNTSALKAGYGSTEYISLSGSLQWVLIEKNDKGVSFNEIANYIEANL